MWTKYKPRSIQSCHSSTKTTGLLTRMSSAQWGLLSLLHRQLREALRLCFCPGEHNVKVWLCCKLLVKSSGKIPSDISRAATKEHKQREKQGHRTHWGPGFPLPCSHSHSRLYYDQLEKSSCLTHWASPSSKSLFALENGLCLETILTNMLLNSLHYPEDR